MKLNTRKKLCCISLVCWVLVLTSTVILTINKEPIGWITAIAPQTIVILNDIEKIFLED